MFQHFLHVEGNTCAKLDELFLSRQLVQFYHNCEVVPPSAPLAEYLEVSIRL